MIQTEDIMTYPFQKLQDAHLLNVATSSDGKLRGYTWGTGCGYNGYDYKLFMRRDGYIVNVDFESILRGEEKSFSYDEIQDFKFFTIPLDGKTYYLIQTHHMKAAGFLNSANIALFTIEDEELVKQTLFETSKELLHDIFIEYSWDDEGGTRNWLFDYDTKTNSIYVPLVGVELCPEALTDRYLIYKWNGKTFRYIGIDKHWSKKE